MERIEPQPTSEIGPFVTKLTKDHPYPYSRDAGRYHAETLCAHIGTGWTFDDKPGYKPVLVDGIWYWEKEELAEKDSNLR